MGKCEGWKGGNRRYDIHPQARGLAWGCHPSYELTGCAVLGIGRHSLPYLGVFVSADAGQFFAVGGVEYALSADVGVESDEAGALVGAANDVGIAT